MVDINELKTQQRIFRQEETNIKNKFPEIKRVFIEAQSWMAQEKD